MSLTRSEIMSRVRHENTDIEIMVRKRLHANGFRFRKNVRRLPGCPDVVLPKYKSVLFIHGCFWHGHSDCRFANLPKSNREFWENKIQYNRNRDESNVANLKKLGWQVIVVWQCELKNKRSADQKIEEIIQMLKRK